MDQAFAVLSILDQERATERGGEGERERGRAAEGEVRNDRDTAYSALNLKTKRAFQLFLVAKRLSSHQHCLCLMNWHGLYIHNRCLARALCFSALLLSGK